MRDADYSLAGTLGSSVLEQAIQAAQIDGDASDLDVHQRKRYVGCIASYVIGHVY